MEHASNSSPRKPLVPPLPVDAVMPALAAAIGESTAAVLVAPPGAGKTTRVPLVLAEEAWAADRKVIVLAPRRLAARAAAARMAAAFGEEVGGTVGLRMRFGSKVSARTRIEVVTEGVFTRLVLDDPELKGVAAVLFDEFHERSLDADLGLALARDAQTGLREDLKLLVMSATLDGARVAQLLGGAPVIEARGRAFPVETRYLGRDPARPIERQTADAVLRALRVDSGSVLVFLPGAAEIRRTEALLRESVGAEADVAALYGALGPAEQDRAVLSAPPGRRKVVLATSIAETSLTIEGVRVVIDAGLARMPRFEPAMGLGRLETVRVSRASADQRRGRAGRNEPGVCYRLWDEPQTASLEPFAKPEILASDLTGFLLDLAQWGVSDPARLAFLDVPPPGALAAARAALRDLGAIDADGRITAFGQRLRALPLPPRLARMVIAGAEWGAEHLAADIALLLTERGLGGGDIDLSQRLDEFGRDRSQRAAAGRAMARRWAEIAKRYGEAEKRQAETAKSHGEMAMRSGEAVRRNGDANVSPYPSPPTAGALLALAFPERVARNRGDGTFVLANGRGAAADPASPLAREPFLAIGDISGSAARGRVLTAAPITDAEITALFAERIESRRDIAFDEARAALRARSLRRLGAVTLAEAPEPVVATSESAAVLARGVAALGISRLPWTKDVAQWRDRVAFLRRLEGEAWPDLSDAALAADIDWLAALFADKTALAELTGQELASALEARLPWNLRRRLDTAAPTHFLAPSGSRVAIDYADVDGPRLAIRVQELFGLNRHPAVADGRVPLQIALLSPAHRPVQVTRDLPGFWRGSYQAVKAEMKGRYPRHPWPDDPILAPATRRAKPRGT